MLLNLKKKLGESIVIIYKFKRENYLRDYIHQLQLRNLVSILIKLFLGYRKKSNFFLFLFKYYKSIRQMDVPFTYNICQYSNYFFLNRFTFSLPVVCEHFLLRFLTFFSKWCILIF